MVVKITFATNLECMPYRYFFIVLFAALVSCTGNDKPSAAPQTTEVKDSAAVAALEEGKELFLRNCITCHAVNNDLTGPALKGVESRWKDRQKLYAFVRNSQEVIKDDAYAQDLFNRWNKVQMTPFTWLKDEQVEMILKYIKSVEE